MLALDKKMHYGYFVIDASNIHKVYAVMPALEKFTYDEGIFTEETCNRRRKQWLGFITKREWQKADITIQANVESWKETIRWAIEGANQRVGILKWEVHWQILNSPNLIDDQEWKVTFDLNLRGDEPLK